MKHKKKKSAQEYVTFREWKRDAMRNAEFRKAYKAIQPKYDVICAILDARTKRGITQSELARRAGTTQSAIARFESGAGNPTLSFLVKVSEALGKQFEVRVR